MNRSLLQQLAQTRIEDAAALLAQQRWDAAYYLCGYAVECGLKSCIIARLMITDEFPAKKFSEQCWTHDLTRLLDLAGLSPPMAISPPNVQWNWGIVSQW